MADTTYDTLRASNNASRAHKRSQKTDHCELCERKKPLTFHHLIPRRNHKNKWFRKRFDRLEMAHRGLWLCSMCHRKIHQTFDEKTLGKHFNTREAILSEPEMRTFLEWVKGQR